jgi:hypothetical protein
MRENRNWPPHPRFPHVKVVAPWLITEARREELTVSTQYSTIEASAEEAPQPHLPLFGPYRVPLDCLGGFSCDRGGLWHAS